jgi:hypothetical protein
LLLLETLALSQLARLVRQINHNFSDHERNS